MLPLTVSGLLSNQGEKSIDFYFIMVPLRKKVLKYGTPKPSFWNRAGFRVLVFVSFGFRFSVWGLGFQVVELCVGPSGSL